MTWGILFQPGALWMGAHYSRHDRRWCINLVPCVTIWITRKGGRPPFVTTKMVKQAANELAWRKSCDKFAKTFEKARLEREHNELVNSPKWIAQRRENDEWHDRNGYHI